MKSKLIGSALCIGTLAPLTACGYMPNDYGQHEENSFTLTGDVISTNPDYLQLGKIIVIAATGSAKQRFSSEATTDSFDDNYNDFSCRRQNTTGDLDELVNAGKLQPGTEVRLIGTIGQSTYECTPGHPLLTEQRPLITSVEVVAN